MIAKTPRPPYYAVIFSSIKTVNDIGYDKTSSNMLELAKKQKGFLGIESARNELGITVSYWDSLKNIKLWKEESKHKIAQKNGKEIWYKEFKVRICKVERDYEFRI